MNCEYMCVVCCRCGNVAAILELDEHLQKNFTIFEAAPQVREISYTDIRYNKIYDKVTCQWRPKTYV